jgi:RimJ/RimL family protein N-acetyltransferase
VPTPSSAAARGRVPVRLVPFDENYLDRSFGWLSDPEIAHLTRTPAVERAAQRTWFDELGLRQDYWVRGIECEGNPAGAVGLRRITADDAEFFIYLGEREYWGRGVFRQVLPEVLAEARRRGLSRVTSKIGEDNTRSIRAHEALGWVPIGRGDDLIVGSWTL